MRCPYCSEQDLKVTDSRDAQEINAVKRRRECLKCGKRFTTFETIELTMQVQKRDGRYEEFKREKLVAGLEHACRHTKISHDGLRTLAAQITTGLMEKGLNVVNTTEIGKMIMEELRKLDPVAYVRFACVYRRFKDVDEIVDAIETSTLQSN